MLSITTGASAPLSPSAQATLNKHLPNLSKKRLISNQKNQHLPSTLNVQTVEVGCLTDLCNNESLNEIEIFSLLEEQIPKYKVRSDFLTDFTGYSNEDWFISAPALTIPSEGLGLTKEQTRQTLNYFLLCGNRVSQMTRAYDDIEAVTRLLEEKEKDLELTVQIGKELLTQNNTLENKVIELEAELKESNDDRAQLLHELNKKNELIAVLTSDAEDSNDVGTPTFSKSITLELLQKKISSLQEENRSLKMETSQLACQTDAIEAHEKQLMEDITAQLSESSSQYDYLSLEFERQREENRLQYEQIVNLTARLAEAEMRLHKLTDDNDENLTLLNITKENQNSLALELVEFKQRYSEVLALLQEAQEQLRKQRKKAMPQARNSFVTSMGLLQPDSLHLELMESSMNSENSLDSGISGDNHRLNDRISRLMSQTTNGGNWAGSSAYNNSETNGIVPPYKSVFETVRCASKFGNFTDNINGNISMSHIGAMAMYSSSSSGPRMSAFASNNFQNNMNFPLSMGGKTLSCESLASQSDDNYPVQSTGVPGAPGAKDLEAALKRLSPAEVLARRAMLSYAPVGGYNYEEQSATNACPLGISTPDSMMSMGSSGISSSTNMSTSVNHWRLPEKLQIVKPIEGSQTLHHWSCLATPTLSGLLEDRPGVTIRGGRGADELGMQMYTLYDVEEDVSEELPGKQFETSGCTYTLTTSNVMHPDDGIINDLSFLSQSQISSRMASTSTSRQTSCPSTPRGGLSRRNSCSTFSVNLGLASMLNERGIKAVTPSALNTPAGPNFSPTVTPCNSPEGTPSRSTSPEPLFGLLSSGADLIRRKLVGGIERPNRNQQKQKIILSRLEKRALRSLKLMEKVESIGLENIIASQPSVSSQLASGIASRSSSPLIQIGDLRQIHTSSNDIVDDIQFDREHIKSVLHMGLKSPLSKATGSGNFSRTDVETEASVCKDLPASELSQKLTKHQTHRGSDMHTKPMQRQKSRRNMKNGTTTMQRPDLGTAGVGRVRPDLGQVVTKGADIVQNNNDTKDERNDMKRPEKRISVSDKPEREPVPSIAQSFVGTVSSLLFGRKGGWL